mgnify:CR=1 FL=1
MNPMTRSKRPGRDDQHVFFLVHRTLALTVRRHELVPPVDQIGPKLLAAGRQVEALHLNEQLVDDADASFAH